MRRTFLTWISAILLISILLAACAPTITPVPATQEPAATTEPEMTEEMTEEPVMTEEPMGSMVELPPVDPADLSGNIVSAGSSTVFPLAEAIATQFEAEGFSGQITIDEIGSGAGFERFCVAGETDVSNASRAIRDSEIESCNSIGREPIEFRVGTDAIAVSVSAENDFITEVTIEQLQQIFSTAENWSDVDPSWPNEPILRYIPGTDSGTFDFFVETVFDEDPEPMLNASNLNLSENDNVLVQGILGSPYAIGFFGYAYYFENEGDLTALSIDGVPPTEETAEDNSYLLARPLFIYSDAGIMQAKPQVAGYINYFLTNVNDLIGQVGYFPASAAALDTAKNRWQEAMDQEVTMPEESAMEAVMLPAVDPADLSGNIVSAGSSTVFPLAEAVATQFEAEGFSGQITIDEIGSGAGFERFCVAGETDVSNASRAIRDSEIESCNSIGREPIEFRVGTDAIAVSVSAENDFIIEVTIEQLQQIFSTAENWSDVDPSWPNEPILRYIPGTDSGTFDFFVETVFDEDPEPMLNAANLNLSENDNVLVQGILGSPYAIGFFGYAYYFENEGDLTALSIDGVPPTEESAEDNSYLLARPLFIYSDAGIMQAKPQVAGYINYFLTNVNDLIGQVGYFPASAAALDGAKNAWLTAMEQ